MFRTNNLITPVSGNLMIKILLVISVFLVAGAIDLRLLYALLWLAGVGAIYYSLWFFGFRIANARTSKFATAAIKALVISITFSPGFIAGGHGGFPAPAVLGLLAHTLGGFDSTLSGLNALSLLGVWFIATILMLLCRKYLP